MAYQYSPGGTTVVCSAIIGDVSGNTITWGGGSGIYCFTSVAALSPTRFVVTSVNSSYYGTAVIGDVSGSTITWVPASVFNSAVTYCSTVSALSENRLVVAYRDTSLGTAVIGDISGNTITWGPKQRFNPASTDVISAATLSSARFVVAYQDAGNSNYGTATLGNVPVNVIGIAKQSGTAGDTVPVIVGGISDVHSGLLPGAVYYCDAAGHLTTAATDWRRVGLAVSATELLLDIQRNLDVGW